MINEEFIDTLEDLGFYKYCDPAVVAELKSQFLNGGSLFHMATKRVYPFDFEYLAEGDVKKYLEELSSFLRKLNVLITKVDQVIDYDNLNYRVIVNDTEFAIYLQSELKNIDTWGLTTIRTFTLVNYLLDKAKAIEKFFLLSISDRDSRLYSDGDEAGIFLTKALHEFICDNSLLPSTKEIFWLDDSEFKLISSELV